MEANAAMITGLESINVMSKSKPTAPGSSLPGLARSVATRRRADEGPRPSASVKRKDIDGWMVKMLR